MHPAAESGRGQALRAAAVAALFATLLPAQARPAGNSDPAVPRIDAAVAAAAARGAAPGWSWLCEQFLPGLPAWPNALDARAPLAIRFGADGLQVAPTAIDLPDDVVAAGSARFGEGPPFLWRCDVRGTEDWFVPHDFVLPPQWRPFLRAIAADALDLPRTLAVPVLASHLAGAAVDGDPRATAIGLGSAQCGELTWIAWRTPDGLRVRGHSGGGVMLPVALLALAVADGSGSPHALGLRAFAARDADRGEAARQLGRDDRPPELATLRCLLCADDPVRLTAIDALVRQRAADELPRIVAAASPRMPWATLAAGDALRALWADASPTTRQATRAALQRSDSVELRGIDVDRLPDDRRSTGAASLPPPSPFAVDRAARARALFALALLATGVLGLWWRERALLHTGVG